VTPREYVEQFFARPGSIAIVPANLATATGISVKEAEAFLDADERLTPRERRMCGACGKRVDDYGKRDSCPHERCGVLYAETPTVPSVIYGLEREAPRDISWLLVVHGMNTRGDWQEEFNWLVDNTYKTTIPVAIYKYGVIRPGVMFGSRQYSLMRKLIAEIKKRARESQDAGNSAVPDVIAHSFGTWLIAHALLFDPSLRIGRLILLGSVVRPDFPWHTLGDRVDAVLNHGGTRDEWVPLAQWFIPDSGPGGKHGFAKPVINVRAKGFRHSDYFRSRDVLHDIMQKVWQPFLAFETPPPFADAFDAPPWNPAWAPLRILTWLLGVALLAAPFVLLIVWLA
jgi:hypothetical protein